MEPMATDCAVERSGKAALSDALQTHAAFRKSSPTPPLTRCCNVSRMNGAAIARPWPMAPRPSADVRLSGNPYATATSPWTLRQSAWWWRRCRSRQFIFCAITEVGDLFLSYLSYQCYQLDKIFWPLIGNVTASAMRLRRRLGLSRSIRLVEAAAPMQHGPCLTRPAIAPPARLHWLPATGPYRPCPLPCLTQPIYGPLRAASGPPALCQPPCHDPGYILPCGFAAYGAGFPIL